MLLPSPQPPFTNKNWQLLNSEASVHVLGAEILHNIYQKHWPPITSLHLRHTIVEYKRGMMNSYVLKSELDFIEQWLGEKLLGDSADLMKEIRTILRPTYKETRKLNARIKHIKLQTVSDEQLVTLLLDSLHVPVGEIYKLHLVQLEYALRYAINKLLDEYEPIGKKRSTLQLQLEKEFNRFETKDEIAFRYIVSFGKKHTVSESTNNQRILTRLKHHLATYSAAYSEYARPAPTLDDYVVRYKHEYKSFNSKPEMTTHSNVISSITNKQLRLLCEIMMKIRPFRANNKAMLGTTHAYRVLIVDEIAQRKNIERDDLNYYLSTDLCLLVNRDTVLNKKEINKRRQAGITLVRNEDRFIGTKTFRNAVSK